MSSPIDLSKYKDLFLKAGNNYLAKLDQDVTAVANGTETPEIIDDMHIAAHSLKGQCLVMGYMTTGNLCLLLEHLFRDAKTNPTKLKNNMSIVFDAINQIKNSMTSIQNQDKEVNLAQFTQQFKQITGEQ
jgi:chemotaxis protein histidine kinase CheA